MTISRLRANFPKDPRLLLLQGCEAARKAAPHLGGGCAVPAAGLGRRAEPQCGAGTRRIAPLIAPRRPSAPRAAPPGPRTAAQR